MTVTTPSALTGRWSRVSGGDVLTPHDVSVDGRVITIPKGQTWARHARRKLDEAMAIDAEIIKATAYACNQHSPSGLQIYARCAGRK